MPTCDLAPGQLGRGVRAGCAASRPRRSPLPNSASEAACTAAVAPAPWTRVVTSAARVRWAARRNGSSATWRSSSATSSRVRSVKTLQQGDDRGVLDVEPVLVEGVGAGHLGDSQIALPALLPNFSPELSVSSGVVSRCTEAPSTRWMRSDARGEVAPLVVAAGLQRAAEVAVQLQVVQALEQLVAELGVGDALVAVQPRRDRLLLDHLVDPEVLADVAQEVQRRHGRGPVEVVDEDRGVLALGRQERLDLPADVRHPLARSAPWSSARAPPWVAGRRSGRSTRRRGR